MAIDPDLREMVTHLLLRAAEIGAALPDDGPSELGDLLAAHILAEFDVESRSHLRAIFSELRGHSDRGFAALDRALKKPELRVVSK